MAKDTKTLPLPETLDLLQEPRALSMIRTETALSRFPMHRLSKSKAIQIDLKNDTGSVYWNVSHNAKFGHPGPLAYKLDTLLINRRIEEAGKPLPRIIRLGSMPEIAQEMGFTTRNWDAVRLALFQNASAFITAKITYKTTQGSEKWLEAGFTRYQVILTGESLPEQGVADAVYIVLSDVYREILNTAIFRPLDYEYMKSLPPAAQRFYEIVSYQIFAAVKHGNPRAKLLYSEYCKSSTATRYLDFDHVKKQMYKIHRPHTQSGYIAKVSYEAITNEAGEPDWWMYYTPGANAGKEYQAFTGVPPRPKTRKRKGATNDPEAPALPLEPPVVGPVSDPRGRTASEGTTDPGNQTELIQRLVAAELNRGDAERFAQERPEVCQRQLDYLPHIQEFKNSQGAYLRRAIENDFGPPTAYAKARRKQEQSTAARRQRSEAAFQAAQEKARQGHQERFYEAYLDYLRERVGETKQMQPEAYAAFLEGEREARAKLTSGPFAGRPLQQKALEVLDQEATQLEHCRDYFRERGTELLDFWGWDQTLNPERFTS